MAVVQISQIQIRRGLLQDLGQLSGGEFGWAIDKLRLFIGNGTIEEGAPYLGNTELLTSNSDILELLGNYSFKGLQGGYQVATGISSLAPTLRTYQDKTDDVVNIKDFGAKGDGFNDDTEPIQRAINEIYGRRAEFTPVITRRTINFHPGVYKITADLLLPPYCVFRNSGKDSVIILQTSTSANCVIRTTDPTGLWNNLTAVSQIGPIEISGISFNTNVNNIPIAILDSAKDVSFNRCKFTGTTTSGNLLVENNSRSLRISSNYSSVKNINFNECDFSNAARIAEIQSNSQISGINFDKCTFSNAYRGLTANSAVRHITGIRVTNSIFANIAQQAISTDSNIGGVVSAFNTYINVGNNYLGNGFPQSPVIEFMGDSNYSIADIITRTEADSDAVSPIKHHGNLSVSTDSTTSLRYGNTFQTVGKTKLFDTSTINYIKLPANIKSGLIDYSIERGNIIRSGKINYVFNNNQSVQFHESYTETETSGVNIDISYSSHTGNSLPYIVCSVDSANYMASLSYDIKSLSKIN